MEGKGLMAEFGLVTSEQNARGSRLHFFFSVIFSVPLVPLWLVRVT